MDNTYTAVCPYCLKQKRNWHNLMTMHIGSCVFDHRYKDLIPVTTPDIPDTTTKDSDSSSASEEYETDTGKSTTPDPNIETQHRMLAEQHRKKKQPPKGTRGKGKGQKTGNKRITFRNPSHKEKRPMSESSEDSTSESESESMFSQLDTPGGISNTNKNRPNTSNTSNTSNRNRNNPNTSNTRDTSTVFGSKTQRNKPNISNTRDTAKDFTYDRVLKRLNLPRGGRYRDALGQWVSQS